MLRLGSSMCVEPSRGKTSWEKKNIGQFEDTDIIFTERIIYNPDT